jgi:hypothetical protein
MDPVPVPAKDIDFYINRGIETCYVGFETLTGNKAAEA